MARDFTLAKYEQLLKCIADAGYEVSTVADYLICEDMPLGLWSCVMT